MTTFNDLFASRDVPSIVSKALEALKFDTPTPIQEQAIPVGFSGKDLIGCAQTGTGKTAAFSIPTLVHLLKNPNATALVLVPTRELAVQIEQFWIQLTKFARGASCVTLIGGMPMYGQMKALQTRRPRLFIATPGRLCDHLGRGSVKLSQVEILILDEADRMLDMGFAPQLSEIRRFLPEKRQTMFFSATWAPTVDGLAAKYLRGEPVRVSVGTTNQAAPKIRQSTIETTAQSKNAKLLDELNQREGSVLVFARTQVRTDRVAKYLNSYGMEVGRIHGGRTQGQRTSALNGFRTGKTRILIATDIAARGIDVTGIAHVINYDLPQLAEDYVHRIGRTGRAGAEGEAVSLLTPEDRDQWRAITRLLQKKEGGVEERPARAPSHGGQNRGGAQQNRGPRQGGRGPRSEQRTDGRSNGGNQGRQGGRPQPSQNQRSGDQPRRDGRDGRRGRPGNSAAMGAAPSKPTFGIIA